VVQKGLEISTQSCCTNLKGEEIKEELKIKKNISLQYTVQINTVIKKVLLMLFIATLDLFN